MDLMSVPSKTVQIMSRPDIAHETATPASATVSKGCFTGGSGSSAGDPVVICDYAGLKNMANGLNKHYVLGDHIDASASWSEGAADCTPYDGETIPETTPCSGMTPLGTATTSTQGTRFSGTLDGRDFEIRKLYINTSANYVGLFRATFDHTGFLTVFKNIHLRSIRVNNTSSFTYGNTGGLVGYLNEDVNNCSVTGKVSGHGNVAGLVGQANGASVSNSYGNAHIVGRYAGVLLGKESSGGIYNSHAKGSVHGNSSSGFVGGLTGGLGGSIIRSYANVAVSGDGSRGSLVGGGDDSGVYDSYGVGSVAGGEGNAGGLIGIGIGALNSFWDTQTTGQSTSAGGAGAVGLATEQMQVACPAGTTTGICALGDSFVFEAGKYPKVKKCLSNCNLFTATFSDELVGGQEE